MKINYTMEEIEKNNSSHKVIDVKDDIIKHLEIKNQLLIDAFNEVTRLLATRSKHNYYFKYNDKYIESDIINDILDILHKCI